jgi:hypothetical protein
MDHFASQPDLSLLLPRHMFYQLIHTLCGCLPLPVSDSPEDRVRRDNAAIAYIASLLPANADEANIAAQYVAANAQALDCLRLAREHPADSMHAMKLTALSIGMMRQARAARSLLMRVQAQREKREADAGALDKASWAEHCIIGLLADALGRDAPAPLDETVQDAEPQVDLVAEAEQYAITHPRRAALIRAHGGLPPRCDFGPPDPELLHAIVTGSSPILCALDAPVEVAAAAE